MRKCMVFFQLNGFVITFIKKFKIYVPLDKLFWHWIIVYYREKGRFSWKVILYHCRLHTYEYLTQKKIIPICTHSVEFDSFYWAEIYGRPCVKEIIVFFQLEKFLNCFFLTFVKWLKADRPLDKLFGVNCCHQSSAGVLWQ